VIRGGHCEHEIEKTLHRNEGDRTILPAIDPMEAANAGMHIIPLRSCVLVVVAGFRTRVFGITRAVVVAGFRTRVFGTTRAVSRRLACAGQGAGLAVTRRLAYAGQDAGLAVTRRLLAPGRALGLPWCCSSWMWRSADYIEFFKRTTAGSIMPTCSWRSTMLKTSRVEIRLYTTERVLPQNMHT